MMKKAEDIDLDQILNPTKYRLNFKRSPVSKKKSDKSLMSGVSMLSDMSQGDTESPTAKGRFKKKQSMILDEDHINEDIQESEADSQEDS